LKVLDGTATLNESDSPKKKKKKAVESDQKLIQISDQLTLDLHLRILQGIEGVYLNDENCSKGPDYLDQLSETEKASTFWLVYTDHNGHV